MKALFADSVADYDANRPGCPVPLYDFLIAECNMDGHSVIVDVGIDDIEGYFASSSELWEWSQYRVDPLELYDDELA